MTKKLIILCLLIFLPVLIFSCGTSCRPEGMEQTPQVNHTSSSPPVDNSVNQVELPNVSVQRVFPNLSFSQPVFMLQRSGDPNNWYLLEKGGRIFRFPNNNQTSERTVALDLRNNAESGPMEAGLLGMAFHPNFENNGYIFISYTAPGAPLVSRISRFRSNDNGLTINPESEVFILTLQQPYTNHNGGTIMFGPDNYLYIGFGDGGGAGDPLRHAQNRDTLFGSILRIDVDNDVPYRIPPDNPFQGASGRDEIFAYGLRNPWKFSFDRETGELWTGDVGQNSWEEINIIRSGENYGWNYFEGSHPYLREEVNREQFTFPVAEYGHDVGQSVTGGYVYRGTEISPLQGVYVYGDYVTGRIWGLVNPYRDDRHSRQLTNTDLRISSFAESNTGELYLLDFRRGTIHKLMR
jgi:glucose/arabinose dehydrogenase